MNYLGSNTEHLERGRDIEIGRNADVTEIDAESAAPDTEPVDVEDRLVTGQRQHQRLGVVASQRLRFTVLVGNFETFESVFGRVRSAAHPEEGICSPNPQKSQSVKSPSICQAPVRRRASPITPCSRTFFSPFFFFHFQSNLILDMKYYMDR